MKVFYDIKQGSDEWHEIRHGKIGGTLASGLFTKTDNLLDELLTANCEDYDPFIDGFVSSDMQRGNELQPEALKNLIEYTKIDFIEVGWLQCEDNELLGISPDGITENFKISCEIKCPGAKRHTQTIKSNEIPLDNIHQCIHYFTVNPFLERHFFCSYRPENKFKQLFVKELTRDSVVNIGTNAKPIKVTINEAVKLSRDYANAVLIVLKKELDNLSF